MTPNFKLSTAHLALWARHHSNPATFMPQSLNNNVTALQRENSDAEKHQRTRKKPGAMMGAKLLI
jgi:hypothetical protein